MTINGIRNANLIYVGKISDTEGKKLVLHHLKVELGNVATDWTPAPKDAMTAIQNNASDIATLQQKVSSISEDDILAKTKQYVDDDILNGKW